MATISNIAQRILDENDYTTSDISTTKLEYLIDNAIDYINAQTGLSISNLSGSAGSKTLTYTSPQHIAIKALTNLMLKAYLEKGSQVGIGGVNISYLQSDPDYKLSFQLFNGILNRLKSPPIYLSEDPVPTE